MGLQQSVAISADTTIKWDLIAQFLRERGCEIAVRMIDNELCLPDEPVPDNWRELRVSLPGGMVTIQRDESLTRFVVWGNADVPLQQSCNALVSTFAYILHVPVASCLRNVTAEGGT